MATSEQKMRLVSARVTNFGCFHDSGEVPIDDVTALIAENENGKTTFLRALSWWSGGEEFDVEDRWEGADPAGTLDLVALTFDVNDAAQTALGEAGAKAPKQVRVIRNSANEYRVEDPSSGEAIEATRGPTRFEVSKDAVVENLKTHDEPAIAATLADALETAQPSSGIAENMIPTIREDVLPHLNTAEDQTVLEGLVGELESAIASPGEEVGPKETFDVIKAFLPALIYFDEQVDFVQDSITYAEVQADATNHRTMVNLATVAGVDLVKIADQDGHRRQRLSHQAQAKVSERFSNYWESGDVTVFVQLDALEMTLTIEHKGRKQRPSRRSSGLKWQLGFFVNFTAEIKGDLSGAVLLLDEPGLHLHIKQQPKLLELFDDLARDGCRIIYATHLTHMLSPDKPHTFRPLIADPDTPNATKVMPSIMAVSSKSDVMQPVRQALGMGIADAIGLGGLNVIAEGLTERYVLLAMSDFCRDSGRSTLSATTTILLAGGSGKKIIPLAVMAFAENTSVVVLVDDDKAGRSTVRLLEKILLGAVPIVRTHDEAQQTDRELEDIFAPAFYLDLVNSAHADVSGYKTIEVKDIDVAKPICNAIEDCFKANGLGKFQKLKPAMELQKRLELGETPDDATLDQFAAVFTRLNEALNT